MGGFVALAEMVATRYYSTPYVKGQNCKFGLTQKTFNPHISVKKFTDFAVTLQFVRRLCVLYFVRVSSKLRFAKKVTVDFRDFSMGGLTPKLDPLATDGSGEFVAPVVLIATRYYSTPCVKYSLRYSGSNFNLFPVAQTEPEIEMSQIWFLSRDVN